MRPAYPILAATLAALCLAAPAPTRAAPRQASPEVAGLVKRCVEAYGGPEAVARAALLRQEGTVTSLLHPGEKGRLLRFFARPGRLRVEVSFGGSDEVRILDGGRGWRQGEEVGGPGLVAMILQAARLDLPAMLQAWPERLVDRGTVELDGRPLRALSLEVAPGVELTAHLDPATGRILRSVGRAVAGPQVTFATRYDDFRVVDGVLVAFREENFANGAITGETVLKRVKVEAALPAETFTP